MAAGLGLRAAVKTTGGGALLLDRAVVDQSGTTGAIPFGCTCTFVVPPAQSSALLLRVRASSRVEIRQSWHGRKRLVFSSVASDASSAAAAGSTSSDERISEDVEHSKQELDSRDDKGARQLSFSVSRRQGFVLSAVVPFVSTLEGFGVLHSASAAEEEAVRLEKIQSEVNKVVSKGKAAGLLRLVFHDAGTFNMGTKTGGMNGSIIYELERPESTGLKRSVRVLEKVKTALDPALPVSWADLIAVAGAESVAICGGPKIIVKLGRLDSLSPDPEGEMPEETLGATELKKTFQQKGFSTQEMIALSGAHTIGNKGFGAPDLFDNTYYKILTQKPWRDSQGGAEMSSSMVGLASDRNLTDDNECMKWVYLYAEDQDKFFLDFTTAYIKLVNTGAKWA